jgi:hypothetical protein
MARRSIGLARRRCAITNARFASNSWICGSRRVTRQRISHTTAARASRAADSAIATRSSSTCVRTFTPLACSSCASRSRCDAVGARLAANCANIAPPSPPGGRAGAAGTAAVARGVGRSLSCIAASSITSASSNPKSGRAPGSVTVAAGAAAAAGASPAGGGGAAATGGASVAAGVDGGAMGDMAGAAGDAAAGSRVNRTLGAPSAISFASAPVPPSPTLASAARIRAEPSTPAGAAPASNTISRTPCAVIRRTTSDTPDSTLGTSCPLAVTSAPSLASVTAPSLETVTSARSDAFCSSTLDVSCRSSQTSRE